jgi:hypothetical protein
VSSMRSFHAGIRDDRVAKGGKGPKRELISVRPRGDLECYFSIISVVISTENEKVITVKNDRTKSDSIHSLAKQDSLASFSMSVLHFAGRVEQCREAWWCAAL